MYKKKIKVKYQNSRRQYYGILTLLSCAVSLIVVYGVNIFNFSLDKQEVSIVKNPSPENPSQELIQLLAYYKENYSRP